MNDDNKATFPTLQGTPHIASVYTLAYENPAAYETSLSQAEIVSELHGFKILMILMLIPWQWTEDIYVVPATSEDGLYSQMSQIKINNVTRDSVKFVHYSETFLLQTPMSLFPGCGGGGEVGGGCL